MPYPLPPGVYFESADPPAGAVLPTRTDVAGFVGLAERGPLHEPVRVDSWTQFETRFGRPRLSYAHLPDAVHGFFANGGQLAWVVRVGRPLGTDRHAGAYLVNRRNEPLFVVRAKDPGLGGRSISIGVTPGLGQRFHLKAFVTGGAICEEWRDLESQQFSSERDAALEPRFRRRNERYVETVVNGVAPEAKGRPRQPATLHPAGSSLITVEAFSLSTTDLRVVAAREWCAEPQREGEPATIPRLGWQDAYNRGAQSPWMDRSVVHGLELVHFVGDRTSPDAAFGLATLEQIDEVAIVAIPDLCWETARAQTLPHPTRPCSAGLTAQPPAFPEEEVRKPLSRSDQKLGQQAMLDHCLRLRDRFAVLDTPRSLAPAAVDRWAADLRSYAGQFGALYYPWVGAPAKTTSVRWLPPSGHVAGVYARVDLLSGVQRAPANEPLLEVQAVDRTISAETRGQLNLAGVNLLTSTAARGVRVMGARTLIDADDSDLRPWRFIAVRRLLSMIEESLDETAQRFVHGGNQPDNWLDLEAVVRNFLLQLWRAGKLDGRTPDEAYSVECSARTNPPFGHERGQMVCEVGVQPPLPSEFVFVRLGSRSDETSAWKQGVPRG